MQMRSVQKILAERNYRVLVVQASAGDDFGDLTLKYLHQVKEENGVMLAVCTADYAEMTSSQYSSHKELRYSLDNDIDVLPLRVEETYPPQPPFGENHPHDQQGVGQALVHMKLPPSLVYLDCREKTSMQIATAVAKELSSEKAGLRARQHAKHFTCSCLTGSECGSLLLSKLWVTGSGEDALHDIVGIEPASRSRGQSLKAFSHKHSPAHNRSPCLHAPKQECDVLLCLGSEDT